MCDEAIKASEKFVDVSPNTLRVRETSLDSKFVISLYSHASLHCGFDSHFLRYSLVFLRSLFSKSGIESLLFPRSLISLTESELCGLCLILRNGKTVIEILQYTVEFEIVCVWTK